MKKVFDGRLLELYTGKRRLPGGIPCYLEEVRHPGASLVVPFLGEQLILVSQYRPVIGKDLWEFPAGTLEEEETPLECARRETAEETGYRADSLEKLGFIYTSPGFCTEKIYIFRAECSEKQEARGDPDEVIQVGTFSREQVLKMFSSGKINDSKTICAMAFAGVICP